MTKIDQRLSQRLAAMRTDRADDPIPVIVTLRPGAGMTAIESQGLRVERAIESVSVVAGTTTARQIEGIAALDEVQAIEYDGETHALG